MELASASPSKLRVWGHLDDKRLQLFRLARVARAIQRPFRARLARKACAATVPASEGAHRTYFRKQVQISVNVI